MDFSLISSSRRRVLSVFAAASKFLALLLLLCYNQAVLI
jgi:hypothetical protein